LINSNPPAATSSPSAVLSLGSFEFWRLVQTENVSAFIESGAVENGIGDLN
jgi:hypothetical protein